MTQGEALAILKTGLNVFLTGEPGSGKTHTINQYVAWLRERGIEPAVCASTGIAATHLGGMTIHSWSGIGIKNNVSDYDIEMIQSREKTAKRIINAKVLIIDEISMLDAATLDSVDRVLRTLRRKPLQAEEPFGGLQVVFVGDFFQLPPVSKKEAVRFSFESQAWKEANPISCYLDEQHRQEDADFLDLLSAFRHGALSAAHRTRLKSRAGILSKQTVATRLYTHNENVDRINHESLGKLPGASHVFRMTSRGSAHLVESLKAQCLSPETLELKEGASVIFTRNNFEAGYVNGTLGEVVGFSSLGVPIVKTKSGATITAEQAEWAIQDGNKILARITQVPLRLAWAITVHKSQGMSLDAAIIDLSQAFEFGQGYVAISRVRSLAGLFLEGFNERALELHPKVAAADRHFRAYSDAARKKFASLPEADKEKLEKNFLRAIGAKEVRPAGAEFSAPIGLSRHAELKEKYPNIGKVWNKEEDALLTKLFGENVANAEIAKHFGRKPSAIRARLGHLGLIENTWFGNHSRKSMKGLDIEQLIKPDLYQVFLLTCPANMPFSFAAHTWLVVNAKGTLSQFGNGRKAKGSRWEVFFDERKGATAWGHVHKDWFPPFQGIEVIPYIPLFWKSRLIAYVEGKEHSLASRMVDTIERSGETYPYRDRYGLLGPNSNTYTEWILDQFPESAMHLPWNAVGKHFGKK